jgi:serine phosphatase RsbU (regulator of sigma subunit)
MNRYVNILIIVLLAGQMFASASDTLFLSAEKLTGDYVEISDSWRFHPGDDTIWASSTFDDSQWDTLKSMMWMDEYDIRDWEGIGWFRKVIKIDSSLKNKSIGLMIHHEGASEIFLNGVKIFSFGKVSTRASEEEIFDPHNVPYVMTFDQDSIYTLAIRYSNHSYIGWKYLYQKFFSHIGFSFSVVDFNEKIDSHMELTIENSSFVWSLFAFYFTFALIFFLLYFFYSKKVQNLFFALFVFGIAIYFLSAGIQQLSHTSLEIIALCRLVQFLGYSLTFISLLLFLYQVVYQKRIRVFWIFLTLFLIVNLIFFIRDDDGGGFDYLIPTAITIVFLLIESIRVVVAGIRRKIKNISILAIGTILFALLFINLIILPVYIDMASSHGPNAFIFILIIMTFTCLPVSMAIYLAKSYSETHNNLEQQLRNVKKLSKEQIEQEKINADLKLKSELERQEYERRTKELDEARDLQLSMLPRDIPQVTNLDLAVYMKTATEVGGDYYDFKQESPDSLIALIGDATGHGMKAGMMVTVAKSLFQNLCNTPQLDNMLQRINDSILLMGFQPMLMSLMLTRIKSNTIEIINGGMPEAWIYKSKTERIIEVEASGPPLGGFKGYKFLSSTIKLEKGDVIILMTDGLGERFNEKNEMLGYKKSREIFNELVHLNAQKIIEGLVDESEKWGGKREQDDDMTFIVIKIT